MPDMLYDPLLAPLFAVAALVAALSLGFALLGALAWMIDGHHPRHLARVRIVRRRHRGHARGASLATEAEQRAARAREVC